MIRPVYPVVVDESATDDVPLSTIGPSISNTTNSRSVGEADRRRARCRASASIQLRRPATDANRTQTP
jgi:hypothetical protein